MFVLLDRETGFQAESYIQIRVNSWADTRAPALGQLKQHIEPIGIQMTMKMSSGFFA